MLHESNVRRLTRSVMRLFDVDKTNITFKNHKEDYYRNFYLCKTLSDGVDFVAEVERTSKIRTVDKLMRLGFSSWMGTKVGEHIAMEKEAREHNQAVKLTSFVIELKRLAKLQGMDISKFF